MKYFKLSYCSKSINKIVSWQVSVNVSSPLVLIFTVFTFRYCHGALQKYVYEDYPVVWLDNDTDYKDI